MASHILRYGDKEFEIRIRRHPATAPDPDVQAHEHLEGEPVEDLPELPGEEAWLQRIETVLDAMFKEQ